MGRAYLITGLLLLALSIVLGSVALQLRYFTSIGPGPGFFPWARDRRSGSLLTECSTVSRPFEDRARRGDRRRPG